MLIKRFFFCLTFLVSTISTDLNDQNEYEKLHLKNFTDSVILSKECKVRNSYTFKGLNDQFIIKKDNYFSNFSAY